MKNLFVTLIVLLLFSCSDNNEENTVGEAEISITATNFLNEVIGIMESNSLNRNTIDWSDFRNEVFEVAGTAQSIDDVYESGAILKALSLLGDNHSFIRRSNSQVISASTLACSAPQVTIENLPENIGYVRVESYVGTSSGEGIVFANEIQSEIRNQDDENLIGWIVDLRGNLGGNMYPMLAGIGPILGEGVAGYFVDANNLETSWSYSNGSSMAGQIRFTTLENSYQLINQNPKVAVLLDKVVASSGEVMAISFIGRDQTRTFGTSTCGLSTGNSGFELSDNSSLALTTVILADRNKNTFGSSIEPDFEVSNAEIIARAVEYLQND